MPAARLPVYDAGPPCVSRAVDAFVRMGMAGVTFGAFMGSYDAVKEGYKGTGRALFVAKSAARNSLGWGMFGGAYMGLNCGLEALRRKRDWVNASAAGAITGAMVASTRSRSGIRVFGTAALFSSIATASEYLRPVQYPPTGL
ncbi:hypothetical protein O6H91_03G107500 [Diphasiastrum complanatum]|uniref:Uncharacterized protein n=1 Tax=Diphasiastrum complanatum TaxID=34168 RepID=A0ACC2EA77_DIPCM|nr:hypothetical protein O6H91_Y051300 [Diphasiastrum complanatum]KAJ7563373.1 hypothetical protein O6H91_03G107500 [Diphasiastrum complanatum]